MHSTLVRMTRNDRLSSLRLVRRGAALLLPFLVAAIPAAAQVSNPVKLLKGAVIDAKSGKPANGGKVYAFEGNSTTPSTNSRINPGTGSYQMILNPSTQYRIRVEALSCYYTDFTVTTPAGNNYEEVIKELRVEPIPIGSTVLSGRLFEPGSTTLNQTEDLRKFLDFMKTQRYVTVTLELTPDIVVAPPVAKKAAKPAPKKKGKKGAAEPVAEPVVDTPQGPSTAERLTALAADRKNAINALLKQEKISLTRVQWSMRDGVVLAPGQKPLPDNVVLKVRGIEVEDDD